MTGTTHTHQLAAVASGSRPCSGTGYGRWTGAMAAGLSEGSFTFAQLPNAITKRPNQPARRHGMPPT